MDSIKINDLTFLRSAAARDNRVESAGIFKEKSLPMDGLSFDTLDADLYTGTLHESLRAVQAGAPVLVYRGEKQYARFVLEGLKRTGASSYHVTANSPMSALTSMPHPGGIYTGQTVEQVARDICGSVPVMVKSNLAGVKLYGWLPYATARDNLSQVLFAVGAYLGTDLNGVLRVEPLWDGVASTVIPDRMYSGGSVEYGSAVSAVTVSEHQYVQGNEDKELFNGTTQAGDLITFDEPMHSLSATGFTILESGANWAKLSAGSGVLTGKAYIHTTRQVTETVTAGAAENIKTVKDATLVSLVNSVAVAKRLADYYRHTEVIKNPVVAGGEKPGHVVSVYHPYNKKMVRACISGADTTMSATLKSDLTALVGFKPPQVEGSQYFDTVDILTASGSWTVPEGVTMIRAVLIGAGRGGWSGLPGERSPAGEIETESSTGETTKTRERYMTETLGGEGGAAGSGGDAGKVYSVILSVTPGQVIPLRVGAGGPGGASGTVSAQGDAGGETTFGELSSGFGEILPSGFFDEIGKRTFALPGPAGIKGGSGNGERFTSGTGWEYVPGQSITVDGVEYKPGADQKSTYIESERGSFDGASSYGYKGAFAWGGYGGGAAYGCNGADGYPATGNDDAHEGYVATTNSSATAKGASGGKGADASPPPAQTEIGTGGRGGNGGGGAGSYGFASVENVVLQSGSDAALNVMYPYRSLGGNGSDGGAGGPGGVLVYYQAPAASKRGPLATRDGKWLLDSLGRRSIV